MADLDQLNPGILRPQGIRRNSRPWRALGPLGWFAAATLALALLGALSGCASAPAGPIAEGPALRAYLGGLEAAQPALPPGAVESLAARLARR